MFIFPKPGECTYLYTQLASFRVRRFFAGAPKVAKTKKVTIFHFCHLKTNYLVTKVTFLNIMSASLAILA